LLQEGGTVVMSPTAADGGSWSWTGPDNFTSVNREVTFSNMKTTQSGTYSVRYTNASGCISSAQVFTITVNKPTIKAQSILIKSENDIKTIDKKNGTLQLTAVFTPQNATDQTVTWTTSNNDLALISVDGLLIAYKDGTVTAQATANDGSGVTGEMAITITKQIVTALDEDKNASFEIYPNPVSSDVTIIHAQNIMQVTLLDVRGKAVKTMSNNQRTINIPVGELCSGVYIMLLTDLDNKKYSRRVVKL